MARINAERMQILTMLQEGKISVPEAERLLEAIGSNAQPQNSDRFLRLRVIELDQVVANVRLPLSLIQGLTDITTFAGSIGVQWQTVLSKVEAGMEGRIVEVEQPNENRKVEIIVE